MFLTKFEAQEYWILYSRAIDFIRAWRAEVGKANVLLSFKLWEALNSGRFNSTSLPSRKNQSLDQA